MLLTICARARLPYQAAMQVSLRKLFSAACGSRINWITSLLNIRVANLRISIST